ncbi:hypothetical protein DICPUDRAFT_42473 [Dictyostelium purpureum]|uniref:3'-5' exonuclease domain-containing protein n=1 Tax=Dictyostelium purpureum TaxID=5786 RepID=F1A260_DICPU|nr:uncharacterized protein DICPUDRAFT_42473 [Dictyostelium purpureum]EGC29725.1 hypothetical protein DICPUDRAFT_42473 [Dictyostelium purpureum]|eukprot:XP_003293751.1 hypothetical protein DICPUDRAFT_42473 [Dictyostelium purpureum]
MILNKRNIVNNKLIQNLFNSVKSNIVIQKNDNFNYKLFYSTSNEEPTSLRKVKREKVYRKLMTLPGRNLKKTLKLLKDNPLDELKKSKEEWEEYISLDQKKKEEKEREELEKLNKNKNIKGEVKIKNLKNVEQMTPEQTSFDNVYMIDDIAKIQFAINQIKKEKQIGLDIEAVEMGKRGEMSLIQISTPSNASVYLFDVLTLGDIIFKLGLKEVLESKVILKVVHDCRRDSEILYHKYQVLLTHVYDIQIAHAIILKKIDGNLPIRRFGFNELTHIYTSKEYSKYCVDIKFKTKQLFDEDNKIWAKRPIPKLLLDYACLDAAILLPIYRTITPKLQSGSDRRFLRYHFNEQLRYFRDSARELFPKNLI